MTSIFILDDSNSRFQILDDVIGFDRPFAHIPAVFAAGKHKNGFTAGIVACLDIAFGIADEEGLLRVNNGFIEGL